MADMSDVETALVGAIAAIAYPAGAGEISAIGVPVRVFRGVPDNSLLLGDRGLGVLDINVFPMAGATLNTTRWGVQTYDIVTVPGLSVNVRGNEATFQGAANAGELAGVRVGNNTYIYTAQAGDSSALVAAALADLIRVSGFCQLSGASLTLPAYAEIIARVAAPATVLKELSRQEQDFRISIWAANPQSRDVAAALLMAGIASISFIDLADGTGGRLRYHSTSSIDADQASSIYRRDIIVKVEYATTVALQAPTVLFGDLQWNGTAILA
jgi:hypothetical protein